MLKNSTVYFDAALKVSPPIFFGKCHYSFRVFDAVSWGKASGPSRSFLYTKFWIHVRLWFKKLQEKLPQKLQFLLFFTVCVYTMYTYTLHNVTVISSLFISLHSGKLQLPNATLLVETFLKRETFIPDPQNTNLMFAFFAQHFTHQFFKTYGRMGRGFTKGFGHGVSYATCLAFHVE